MPPRVRPSKYGRQVRKLLFYAAVIALIANWWVVSHASRPAKPFAGGQVVDIVGPDLNVRAYGNGMPDHAIVLLPGYGGSIEWWAAVAEPLAAKTGKTVLVMDTIGQGGSEAPATSKPYGAVGQALAVRRALAALNATHVTLVGHSMGGAIATQVAAADPTLVDRVAVLDTPGTDGLYKPDLLARAACWPVIGEALGRLQSFGPAMKMSLQRGFADGFLVPDFAYESIKQASHRAICDAKVVDQMNAEQPIAKRLAALGKPVLVLTGASDTLIATASNVAAYRDAGVEPVVIARSGHSPQVERPRKVVGLLADFAG